MGKLGKKVIYFEPMPSNSRLEENLKLNNITYEPHNCIAGKDNIDSVKVHFEHDFLQSPNVNKSNNALTCNIRRVDGLVKDKSVLSR